MCSGTAALWGALKALGVSQAEHHVICQSFTCSACSDAIVHAGGTPVIVDVELDTFSLDLVSVATAVELDPLIVGVMISPCYGCPARDLFEIKSLCVEREIWLLEDNCESYGALSRNVVLGSVGDMSVISVRSEKMIGAGEGGAIMSKNDNLVKCAQWWCSRSPSSPETLWLKYKNDEIGQNYCMQEIVAAVALGGVSEFEKTIMRKKLIHSWYLECFNHTQHLIQTQQPSDTDIPVYWINAFILSIPAEPVGMELIRRFPHIEIRPGFYPLHLQTNNYQPNQFQNSEHLFKHIICLPSSIKLQRDDIKFIAHALLSVIHDLKHRQGANVYLDECGTHCRKEGGP